MVSKVRLERISERMKEELSELLLRGVADPRLSGVHITDVRVDRELSYADIYVSAIEGQQRAKEILEGLEHAQGFLRRELARSIELRVFPKLRFHWDPTPERADRIERLLASLRERKSSLEEEQRGPSQE
ncbi:MAG: 30S ribosome-binding factor RbfA [Anaerolineales bacterium]|nr:30S ribosome-binding factor RbfA [Anaerolineales bacterium]MDW8447595.1 30S ribosome-binding factor RbfA [Anaerolineales bacterium]